MLESYVWEGKKRCQRGPEKKESFRRGEKNGRSVLPPELSKRCKHIFFLCEWEAGRPWGGREGWTHMPGIQKKGAFLRTSVFEKSQKLKLEKKE